jgi:hypothetical protein
MKRWFCFATALGMVLATQSWGAVAQAPESQPAKAASGAAVPQDEQPTKEQLAKLFEAMRVRQQMQSVRSMVPTMVQEQIRAQSKEITANLPGGTKLTPQQQTAVDSVMRKYTEKAINIYPVEEMIEDMTTIYQRHLSRDDVDGMIAFFVSPSGQHLLDEQPVIMQEYMPVIMKRVSDRSKIMTAEMMKEMAEITRPAKTEQPAAPAKK